MTNEHNFKVGDRVICTDDGNLGTITFVDIDEGKGLNSGYEVKFDDGSEDWIMADMLTLSDEPPYDRKTAFLRELQALLRKYDARIEPYFSVCADIPSIDLYLGNDCVESWDRPVTADNIMDFDKE